MKVAVSRAEQGAGGGAARSSRPRHHQQAEQDAEVEDEDRGDVVGASNIVSYSTVRPVKGLQPAAASAAQAVAPRCGRRK